MTGYRRFRVPGGTAFFPVTLRQQRGTTLLTDRIELLRHAVRHVRLAWPFRIDSWVVLPEHLHCIWTLLPGDADNATRWRLIKSFFVRELPPMEWRSPARVQSGERGIWQRRFWEHAILDDADYSTHMDYVHLNPVKHGYVVSPDTWPCSTFRACVDRGLYQQAWLGEGIGDLEAGKPR